MRPLTPSQRRVLTLLNKHACWQGLLELDSIKFLEIDDIVVVPSLIERELVEYFPAARAVRITRAGQIRIESEHA